MEDAPLLVHLSRARPRHPAQTFRFMAERAEARATVEVPGASHALPASQPEAVADVILQAAATI